MQHLRFRSLGLLFVATSITLAMPAVTLGPKIFAGSQRVIIPGHLVPALKGLHPVSSLSPNQQLHVSIGLTLRDRPALDALIQAQDNAKSGIFHRYITPQQFAARFGPLTTTTNAVVSYLRTQGLHINSISSNHALIFASGSVAAVEKAFTLTLANFSAGGRTVYAPLQEPSVPVSLAGDIQNIVGLDNVLQFHRKHVPSPPHPLIEQPSDPSGCMPLGYGPADFYQAYDISPLTGNGYNGSGQTIAIPEFDGYNPSDVTVFDQCFVLPSLSYQCIYVTQGGGSTCVSGDPTYPQSHYDGIEADLDMEVAHEIAPGATERIYLGPSSGGISTNGAVPYLSDINLVYNQIVSDNQTNVVSMSWGAGCEAGIDISGSGATSAELSQMDTILAQGSDGILLSEQYTRLW
jgi:subtilase family serine protease